MMSNESELWSDMKACHFISRVIIIFLNLIREPKSSGVRLLVFLENYKSWKAEKWSPVAFYSVIHGKNRSLKTKWVVYKISFFWLKNYLIVFIKTFKINLAKILCLKTWYSSKSSSKYFNNSRDKIFHTLQIVYY